MPKAKSRRTVQQVSYNVEVELGAGEWYKLYYLDHFLPSLTSILPRSEFVESVRVYSYLDPEVEGDILQSDTPWAQLVVRFVVNGNGQEAGQFQQDVARALYDFVTERGNAGSYLPPVSGTEAPVQDARHVADPDLILRRTAIEVVTEDEEAEWRSIQPSS